VSLTSSAEAYKCDPKRWMARACMKLDQWDTMIAVYMPPIRLRLVSRPEHKGRHYRCGKLQDPEETCLLLMLFKSRLQFFVSPIPKLSL
jgi:hypothetical protein